MELVNYIGTIVPFIPEYLTGKLTMVANYPLNNSDVHLFDLALKAISKALELDHITKESLTTVNVIFTKDGSFSIIEESPTTFGLHCSLAVYALEKLNAVNNEKFKLVSFIEELVHHYWRIEDETTVKYKVVQIAQMIDPSITIDLLKEWDVNGL